MNASVISEQPVKSEQEKQSEMKNTQEKQSEVKNQNLDLTQIMDTYKKNLTVETGPGRYIYSVFHTIMSLIAIYLAFRCNRGFDFGSFLVACCCPYLYIIYILATRGTCGILED